MISLLTGAIGLAKTFLEGRTKVSGVRAEAAAHATKADAEANAKVKVTAAGSVAEWERLMAVASGDSWKDEAWTLTFIGIIVLCFIPGMQPYVAEGFRVLGETPEWFQIAIGASIAASFCIRGIASWRAK